MKYIFIIDLPAGYLTLQCQEYMVFMVLKSLLVLKPVLKKTIVWLLLACTKPASNRLLRSAGAKMVGNSPQKPKEPNGLN